ncbi:DUF6907 domain-containing protein [Streptomyces sp. NPDC091416]|uniref:DUF6907 domain-containing protein n=1 Tax=Streptomyces sp. NPDC091416 TaxID=3366003 RepID=UPI003813FC7A
MSEDRTVTVPTLDCGDVTVPEPGWCVGHDGEPVNALCDLGHRGTEHFLGTDDQAVFVAQLSQYPHGSGPRDIHLYIEAVTDAASLAPEGVEALATVLAAASAQLRPLALQLAVLRTEEAGR